MVEKIFEDVIIWGCGQNLDKYYEYLDQNVGIKGLVDSNVCIQGKQYKGHTIKSPRVICQDDIIIITPESDENVLSIREHIMNASYTISELQCLINIRNENDFVKTHKDDLNTDNNNCCAPVMRKYIGIHYPATTCNLSCAYCYIRQKQSFYQPPILNHSVEYIRWCFSKKRLGGTALIVICGEGETLLGDKIIDVSLQLLQEGHFLHIVTNGTVTRRIEELIDKAGDRAKQLFFKLSFHYLELKNRGLLDQFEKSVEFILNSEASFTIELTADDNLVPYIDELKQYSILKFGALPHITIARDDTKPDIPILTKYDLSHYYNIWSQFNSSLFAVKWKYYKVHIFNCSAGEKSLYVDLLSGNVMKCLGCSSVGNIYDSQHELIEFERIGDGCRLPYCYNNHAYLTLGNVEDIKTVSFAEVRDRVTYDGKHWVKDSLYNFISQKLYDNN